MRRSLSTLVALCLGASLAWPASPVEAAAVPADSARVIVKFKADSPLLRELDQQPHFGRRLARAGRERNPSECPGG